MAQNYILLERIELNASATSVTFDNIPQTGYTDLKVVVSARSTRTGYPTDDMFIQFNGSTTTYTAKTLRVLNNNSVVSTSETSIAGFISDADQTASTFASTEFYIPNYNSTTTYKSVSVESVSENNASASTNKNISAGLWSTDDAITSMAFSLSVGNFVQYSTFSLYGLAADGTTPVIAPKASGGNIVANDGTYWYHAFLSSGTFTPAVGLSCDVLLVAGGGGSYTSPGGGGSGGGGAGGLLYLASETITANNYSVQVGAGGSDANGNNSQLGALTAAVGGGRGGAADTIGSAGGSGGGTGFRTPSSGTAAGTASQGNSGGNTSGSFPNYNSGGGGGAGAAGGTGGTNGGAGGAGLNTYSSWATATSTGVSGYYAGGGGGMIWYSSGSAGAGGAGGGGAGASTSTGTGVSGTANTGGGAGGSAQTATAGGSGIVIIRYPIA